MSIETKQCALCGERVGVDRAVVGDVGGAVCIDCVWLSVDVLEDRGEVRPLVQKLDDETENSAVFDRRTIPPAT
ncbi:MAG: hypothetical protein KC657_05435 [Myxococcales bacterium]|nr:hypothetical protein [Myxococcales bacterium]